ncbi:hypothetical protein IJ103_00440 [Candidatus Saccharibacteria bacterium]|nr:hypothetical protein [Candidatus Saccharibacteria bacterium]
MSIVFGLSQRIATGRFNTGSSELVAYLRDVFTGALNTENGRSPGQQTRAYCTLSGSVVTSDYVNGVPQMAGNSISSVDDDNYPGRTDCAIYGKVIFFGASDDIIYAFDVVGDVVDQQNVARVANIQQTEGVIGALKAIHADYTAPIFENETAGIAGGCKVAPALSYSQYTPSWGITLKTANYSDASGFDRTDDFVGMAMIVRAPTTGDVVTYFYQGSSPLSYISDIIDGDTIDVGCSNNNANSIRDYTLDLDAFADYSSVYDDGSEKNQGFCLDSDDFWIATSNLRKFVRFIPGGQNPSAIELDASEENPCRKS